MDETKLKEIERGFEGYPDAMHLFGDLDVGKLRALIAEVRRCWESIDGRIPFGHAIRRGEDPFTSPAAESGASSGCAPSRSD